MDQYRAIILTALSKEYLAVRANLDNLTEDSHKGTVYELGKFVDNGRSWTVAIAQVGRHNENAAVEAERAIGHFSPKVAIFMGVAGGVHGVALGDVVAATKVYGYEAGKAKAEFLPTPEVYRSSHAMEQRAMAVARSTEWLKRIKGSTRDPAPNAFVEPIAAGPKVVKSTRSVTYKFLRSNYSDAIAVEMEGLGFLAATHANSEVYALVVRGISDLINHKDKADASGSQEIASQNAAAFAFEILAKLDFDEETEPPKSVIENIPYHRNRNFTGRNSLLDELRRDLTAGHYTALTQAIIGLGGVGKTQLALEYTYRHVDDYDVIWWVRSEEPAILVDDYIELAVRLGLGERTGKPEDLIDAVRWWLENNIRWLLIFDNAQSPRELTRYLPKMGSGHVIITSRNQSWESLAKPLEVLKFERPESVEFLLKRTERRDEKGASALAEALGDLPLALEQAGAYIKETGISFEDYLERFQERRKEILRHGKPDTYPETIATTWDISVEAAGKETPESRDLLNLCAYLSPDLIHRSMLVQGSEHLPDPLASSIKNSVELDKALASLRKYSLIYFSENGFFIHRMVQTVTLDRMGEKEQKKWAEAAVRLIDDAYPKDILDNPQSWASCSYLLPHALAAVGFAERLGVALNSTVRLLNDVGLYSETRGEFDEAKAAFQKALKIDEQIYGPDHPIMATGALNLGSVLQAQGDLPEAKKYYERALKIDEHVYGPDHPEVATDVNNLGSVLKAQGDLLGARKCYEQALKIDEHVYGPDHPDVARDINNLGSVLQAQGDLPEARKYFERANNINKKILPEDHPRLAIDSNNLGLLLKAQGDLPGARKCYERALKIDEKVYGPDHSNVAGDVNNLGSVLQAQGDLPEAKKYYERALKIDEKVYGPDHPNVATMVNNLGSVLQAQGDLPEAKKHYESALKIDEKVYGPDHPNVAGDVNNLGVILQAQDDLPEARKYFERALKIGEHVYGPDHPTVALYVYNLGFVLQAQGDLPEARKCFERALKIDQEKLGETHPHTKLVLDILNLLTPKQT